MFSCNNGLEGAAPAGDGGVGGADCAHHGGVGCSHCDCEIDGQGKE